MHQEQKEEYLRDIEICSYKGSVVEDSLTIEEFAILRDRTTLSDSSDKYIRVGEKYYTKDGKHVNKDKGGTYQIPSLGDKKYYEKRVGL